MKDKYYYIGAGLIKINTGEAEKWKHGTLCQVHGDSKKVIEERAKEVCDALNWRERVLNSLKKISEIEKEFNGRVGGNTVNEMLDKLRQIDRYAYYGGKEKDVPVALPEEKEVVPVCSHCGQEKDIKYLDQYANGDEYLCNVCGGKFMVEK